MPSLGGEVCVCSCRVVSTAALLGDGSPHREQCPSAHCDDVWCELVPRGVSEGESGREGVTGGGAAG